jgi:hypothetical protein
MALATEQIENFRGSRKAGERKWLKNQRNRKIRRVDAEEIPSVKYRGWEY